MVVTVLTLRCGTCVAARSPSDNSIAGAKPDRPTSTSPATASWEPFNRCICRCIEASRSTGSPIPTGRSAKIADTRLLYLPCSSGERTDTGTSERTRSGRSSRKASISRKPPAIAVSTTSLTVPPNALRIFLTSDSRDRAQSQRRCGPIGPLSDDVGGGRRTPLIVKRPWTVPTTCSAAARGEPNSDRTPP